MQGAAESDIGEALTFAYGITDGDVADDLINVLDAKKKLTLLKRELERRNPNHNALPILKDITRAHDQWSNDRNILAHGFGAVGDEGTLIFTAKPKDPLPVSRFPEILNRANWLYRACSDVRKIISGVPTDGSLPDMPS